jgi:hypothetical protein
MHECQVRSSVVINPLEEAERARQLLQRSLKIDSVLAEIIAGLRRAGLDG